MLRRSANPICSVEGCGKKTKGRGWCLNHYMLWLKYGRIEKLPKTSKRKHPNYSIWFERKQRGSLCEEWLDFDRFNASVGARPSPKHFLVRVRRNEPYGPKNFRWEEFLRREPGESNQEWWARKWASRTVKTPHFERSRMVRKYGLTPAEYSAMHVAQDGKCAICEREETSMTVKGAVRSLAVDHCHNTGKVRGLLCSRCNTTLGRIEESPQLLRAMFDYLHKHSAV